MRRILLFRRIAQCTLLYLAYRRPPGEHGFLTLDHTQAICDSPIPDHLSPEYSESDYLLELSCSKACSSATQLRTNYEKSRSQIESIQRSLLSKDDCMSEKIGRYEESILRLTLQVKELQDERESERSGLKHDEWAEKRIQILEEEVSFKNEQVNAHQAAIGKKMNDLSEQHTKEILKVEEKVRTRHTEIDALLEPAVLCSEIVLNLMLDIRTKMHHVDTNLFAKQQESLEHHPETDVLTRQSDGLAFYTPNPDTYLMIVPADYTENLVKWQHKALMHAGPAKVAAALKARYHWFSLKADV